MTTATPDARARFRAAYAEHRAAEGRRLEPGALAALPDLRQGPFAREWAVRARTFRTFVRRVVHPYRRKLKVLDVGAGIGWLSYRLNAAGHDATAVDWRWDSVDGLGAGGAYAGHLPRMFARVAASFDHLPLASGAYDVVVFDASIHYAEDLGPVLAEARRVARPGGQIAILDSPFYQRREDGERMIAEKRRDSGRVFGERANALLGLPAVEYLTRERLAGASGDLRWHRHRVWYPLWYELRPLLALVRGTRRPSRFDLWTAPVP